MDPEAQHVVIADQAGFHLRPGDDRVPEGVHLIPLPPYSPELNPCEQLWDVIKDSEGVANGLFSLKTGMVTGSRRHSGGLCMEVVRQMGCG